MKIFKNLMYSSNECIPEQVCLSIRISKDVLKVLNSAIANAENNYALDIDRLVVDEAFVGKAMVMKRLRARARGRAARILKPFSKLTIILKQTEEKK